MRVAKYWTPDLDVSPAPSRTFLDDNADRV